MGEGLRLMVYVGERDRHGRRLLADELMGAYERNGVRTSALLRGVEGFGAKHRLQSERLLTLSEDLPILALAVDRAPRIEAALADVRGMTEHRLITLERATLVGGADLPPQGGSGGGAVEIPDRETVELPDGEALKLTVYVGRGERVGSHPAHLAVVDCLRRHGLHGASVLLGLDGAAHGTRQRASFFAGNARVPVMILSVGDRHRVETALPELLATLERPTVTLERVRVCRRDGVALAAPHEPTPPVASAAGGSAVGTGTAHWQKLTVYASEQTLYRGESLHGALVRRLRREGAAGATALRGLWGYHGEHEPHGERFFSLRRHVPTITVLIDTPENTRRWFEIVAEMTGKSGLVTSELARIIS